MKLSSRLRVSGYALGIGCLLLIYVGGGVSIVLQDQGWDAFTTHLLVAGAAVVAVICFRTADHLPPSDRDRLRVLTAQVLALTLVGSTAELAWEAKVGDLPVVITLTLAAVWTLTAETLAIRVKHAERTEQ